MRRFSTAGTKRAKEVLREMDRQEERQFLHHQDSRINLNHSTLQHCPANSTNGLFQKRHTHTSQIKVGFFRSSLMGSSEPTKNIKLLDLSAGSAGSQAQIRETFGFAAVEKAGLQIQNQNLTAPITHASVPHTFLERDNERMSE